MRDFSDVARWALRLVLGAGAAALTAFAVIGGVDLLSVKYPAVQADSLSALHQTIEGAAKLPKKRISLVVFGDSLVMAKDVKLAVRAIPGRIRDRLEQILKRPADGKAENVGVLPAVYSGLSLYSLYYMSDSLVDTRPDFVVIEFNLYNFSSFWERRDRKILSAMLDLGNFPEALTLPTTAARQATDQWIFDRLLLRAGALPAWHRVQREQARVSEAVWALADRLQPAKAGRLILRWQSRNMGIAEERLPNNRATKLYAERLFGPALTGIEADHPVLRMLEASLRRFRSAGIHTTVYVPPYNLEHLNSLGVLEGSGLDETIAQVRAAAERGGATFLDLHALLPDAYFRDNMDHLNESPEADGHDKVAERIADALAVDARRIDAERR